MATDDVSPADAILAALDDLGAPGRVGVVGDGPLAAMARAAVELRGGTCEHPAPPNGHLDLLLDVTGEIARWEPLLGAVRREGNVLTMVSASSTAAPVNLYRGIHSQSLRFEARRWDPSPDRLAAVSA